MNKHPYVQQSETRGKWKVHLPRSVRQAVAGSKSGTYTNKQDAIDYAAEVHSAYTSFRHGELTSINISDRSVAGLINQYRQTNKYKTLAVNSKRNYNHYFDTALPICIGNSNTAFKDMLTANVTVKHAEKLQQQVEDLISYNTSFAVINKLSVVWNRGIKLGLARSNPFAEMGLSKPPPRRQIWTDQQFLDFVAHCDKVGGSGLVNPKDSWSTVGTHVILCMHLAQRVGDMRTLKWSNLDDKGLLSFRQCKTKKDMVMPITQLIAARLQLHPPAAHTDAILRNPNTDEPYRADNLRRRFRYLAREMGLPDDIQVMDARRTAATNAANSGATEAEIMSLTGHTRPETLREIYQLRTVTQLNNLNSKRGL